MKKIILGILVLSVSLFAANFTTCSSCHGQNAQKRALGKSQIIKGWSVQKTINALRGYKYGNYGGSMKGVMKIQVARLSDSDIDSLASLISKF